MASQTGNKESVFFLWIIGPIAVLLTLLFVGVNNNTIPPKTILDGNRPTAPAAVETPAAAVAPADSLAGGEVAPASGPAAGGH
jgi:hypothetical protein